MLQEDVDKLLEEKKFIEAEKLLIYELHSSSEPKDVDESLWHQLIEIQKKINSKNIIQTYKHFLNWQIKNTSKKNDQGIVKILEGLKEHQPLELEHWQLYFESLWNTGNIQKYYTNVEDFLDNLVLNKNIPALKVVLPSILERTKVWPKPYYCKLLLEQFTNDVFNAIETANVIIDLIENNWQRLSYKKNTSEKYLKKLLRILEQFETEDARIKIFILRLKSKIFNKYEDEKYRLNKDTLIQLLIVEEGSIEALCTVILNVTDQGLINEVVQLIRQHKDYNTSFIIQKYPKLISLFDRKVSITYSLPEGQQAASPIENMEPRQVIKPESISHFEYERSNYYQCSLEEKEIIAQIEQGYFKDYKTPNDIILAFVELGYLEAAILFLKSLSLTKERLYILCEVMFRLKRFVDVIAEINEAIVRGVFETRLPIEFKYIEAESYLKIGNTHKARMIFREVMLENPSYRQVKARMRNA